jgi:hypothetical protein
LRCCHTPFTLKEIISALADLFKISDVPCFYAVDNVALAQDYLFDMDLGSLIELTLGGTMSHVSLWFEMSSVMVRVRCHYCNVKGVLEESVLVFCSSSYNLSLLLPLNVLWVVQMNVLHVDECYFMPGMYFRIESQNYPFQHSTSLSRHHHEIIDLQANHKCGVEKVNNVFQSSASTSISTTTTTALLTQK